MTGRQHAGSDKGGRSRHNNLRAPVLPGAMFLIGYFDDGTPIMGLPGCVMYAKATVFDIVLPKVAAGIRVSKRDIVKMGNGGLCLGCEECRYPICPFGK